MLKAPKKADDIFPVITADCKAAFGDDLISIILYGSAAGGNYLPGKSDINFMITLTDRGMESLDRAMDMVKQWRTRTVALPLFVTPSYISDSLDSYPVEFINIRRRYKVVYGEDLLAPIQPARRHIRLQIERELRGKLLHLREGWLDTEGKTRKIRELITVSLTAFIALFAALLYLKGIDIPAERRDIITAAGNAFGFNAFVFLDCDRVSRGEDDFTADEIKSLFKNYLLVVGRLCDTIDRLDVQ
jgi:predicted nucleotidyltransferase